MRSLAEKMRLSLSFPIAGPTLLRVVLLASAFFAPGIDSPARAQTLPDEEIEQQGLTEQPSEGEWNITLGAGLTLRPTYQGASSHRLRPLPLVSIGYHDWLFLSPLGLGVSAIHIDGFRAGPVVGYEGGRDESSDAELKGLGNIHSSIAAGIFAAYRTGPFEISGTVRQAVTHADNGLNGYLQASYRASIVPHKLDLAVGPDLDFASSKYVQTWFGVSQEQSQQSGLPIFTPGGGFKSAGLHAALTYHLSDHLLIRAFGGIKELTGDPAKSPIVQNKTQTQFGMGIAYHL